MNNNMEANITPLIIYPEKKTMIGKMNINKLERSTLLSGIFTSTIFPISTPVLSIALRVILPSGLNMHIPHLAQDGLSFISISTTLLEILLITLPFSFTRGL